MIGTAAVTMPEFKTQDYWVKDSIRDKAFEDQYSLLSELGQQRNNGEVWAVKIINKNVRLKEVYESPLQIFLILELVSGGELFDGLCGYEPFYAQEEAQVFRKILKADYSFPEEYWGSISGAARDKDFDVPAEHLKSTVENVKEFNGRRRFKVSHR
nr:hypothetical protein BaRGS_010813 [Batillaria attramentaria]